jgi:translation elongation factor EF-Tu-like GTPase
MSSPFLFFDELRPSGDAAIRVLARIHVLTVKEGGRREPFRGRYRPNHNFGASDNRHFFIGEVEIPDGVNVYPGETHELMVMFLPVIGIAEQLTVGRQWRIQEGGKLVATAEVLSVLPSA